MISVRGGYYVDEISEYLGSIIGKEELNQFYIDNGIFDIHNAPDYISDDATPLLKTLWNIVNRGTPTRASLNLSQHLLKDCFKIETSPIFSKSSTRFEAPLPKSIDKKDLAKLITNFSSISESEASDFGTKIYSVYKYLKKSLIYAQVHKTILLCTLAEPENTSVVIEGLIQEDVNVLISDLNELITNLNRLASEDEIKLKPFKNDLSPDAIKISVNIEGLDVSIKSFSEKKQESLPFNVLTDRHIKYEPLGEVIKSEKENFKGEKQEIHTFKYYSEDQNKSLTFFLNNLFRKTSFRPGQEAIINKALLAEDVIGLLPTGGGKSLTFQLCSVLHPGITVVVDPINSLMKDQYDKLIENGITNTCFINSFNTREEREANTKGLTEAKYLVAFISPERFQMENFRRALLGMRSAHKYFSYAVIDEAHCVSEWGHDFRQVYLNLAENIRRFCNSQINQVPVFGLTATASFDVLADVQRELKLNDDAIVTLPAEAIDRKELNFEIIEIKGNVRDGLKYNEREEVIGDLKYPVITNLIQKIPREIKKLEDRKGAINPSKDFFGKEENKFKNGGVVFCPTKSDRLPNGVLHLQNGRGQLKGLKEFPFLETRTFFGGIDYNSIQDHNIQNAASESLKNQVEFIENKANLMIATKAFGMGIDKPNIRYSIHYSFPNSVESFYQEAGRAGRDGHPSLCYLLYHPQDKLTNYDFYQNAFRGVEREQIIIDELLEEVKYEKGFFLNVLTGAIKDSFPEVRSLNLRNDRYIYINGQWNNNQAERVSIGLLDLDRGLRTYDNATQNINQTRANEIMDFARLKLAELCPEGNYLEWLNKTADAGIKTTIENAHQETYYLKIGFTNGLVSEITDSIIRVGFEDFTDRIVRAAYNFSSTENDFIRSLSYQYYKFQMNEYGLARNEFEVSEDLAERLCNSFKKIRNDQDTQRAIYRLMILGIIDDYVIDYSTQMIEVKFSAKEDEEYINNFRNYLRRYLGIEKTEEWISKINERETSVLASTIHVLIEFGESEIAKKRKRSIDYMQELCEVNIKEGEQVFRERMIRYFTSKYARQDYLPRDTDQGRKESSAIVKKYIDFIYNPPDGLGGPIDNAKHLRGACDNLRINMKENASIDLLTSFSLFALELSRREYENIYENPLIQKAQTLYREGFKRLQSLPGESWENIKDLMQVISHKVADFNPNIQFALEQIELEIILHRTNNKLKIFLKSKNI